ncbi:MAG: D-2-hydroxyacid dehydrogenase [Gammaproteobacteria bacterium]|nr:D-2-hydroxyacid dehydrogenase [Gammaproteobacteria bacterium]
MKAVFLDYGTIGPEDLDYTPLQRVVENLTVYDSTTREQLGERIRDVEIVYTNKIRFDDATFALAKSLKFIGLTATGTDNVDLDAARRHGVAVCNIRAYCTQSVVEHVFGVLLNFTHSLAKFNSLVRAGEWQRADNFCKLDHPLRELSAMTMGIVGYGELGRGVGEIAKQFNMKLLISRRRGTPAVDGDGRTDFDDLIEQSDVISLHCPLNDDTREMLAAEQFRRMKNDAILINTARGGLIDSAALVAALQQGEIAAAAIDVLPQEPPVDGNPLLDYRGDNLLMTPHIAWATVEARQNAVNELAANVAAYLTGERRNRVD